MATEGGGKIKNKRHKDPETPYSKRRSLIGQVTDTVKGVIGGSWLTNLVNSVRKTPPKERDHKVTKEDGSPRGNYPVYPKSLSQGGSFIMTPGREVAPNVDPMNYSPAQVPYTPYMQMAQHVMVNGGDRRSEYPATPGFSPVVNADSSEYSSNMLHLNDSRLQQLRQEFQQGIPHSTLVADQSPVPHPGKMSLGETTVAADEGSFLWSTKPRRQPESQPQVPSKVTKASFNASLFGSSIGDRSVLSSTMGGQSPFYPGKTMFGGAASQRKPQQTTAPYQLPSRKLMTSKPLQQNKAGGVSSSTAKKILETLEKMSTPLTDAKKIPTHDPSTSLLITPVRKRTFDRSNVKEGPPTQQLTPLGFASIAPNKSVVNKSATSRKSADNFAKDNKQDEDDDKVPSPNFPTRRPAIHTNVNSSTFGDYAPGKASGKMRREKGSHHYSSKAVDEDEHVEAPDLPTNFTLPLSGNLPKFSFPASSSVSTNPSTSSGPNGFGNSDVTKNSQDPDDFTFSSPIAKATPSSSVHSTTPNNFEFSSPIKVQSPSTESSSKSMATNNFTAFNCKPIFDGSVVMNSGNPSAVKMKPFVTPGNSEENVGFQPAKELKQGSVMDVLGKPSSGGLKPAAELKKGSVMDVLGKSPGGIQPASELKSGSVMDILKKSPGVLNVDGKSSSQSSTNGFQNLFGKPAVSSTASDSSLNDKSSANELAPKQSSSSPSLTSTPAVTSSSGFGNLFNKPADSWECSACMVQNKKDSTKCVACETPKPGAKPAPSLPSVSSQASSTTSGFGTMFSKPAGAWECSTCMVQNKADLTKCAACETPKPGAQPAPTQPAPAQPASSGFGTMFNKPAGTWECSTCMVQNKSDAVKCAACETPKPGAKPAPSMPAVPASTGWSGFAVKKSESASWECNTCLVMNKPEASKCIACETPKPGAKPTTGFTSPGGFKFGSGGGLKLPSVGTSSSSTANFGAGPAFTPSSAPAPITGGFKLSAAPDTKEEGKKETAVTSSGGFKFGTTSSENKTPPSTGDFKFGSQPSDKKEEKLDDKPAAFGGFKFGSGSSSVTSVSSGEVNAPKSDSKPSSSGVPAAVKTDSSPAFGGFKFNAAGSKSNTDTPSVPAAGGFTFPTTPVSTTQSAANTDSKSAASVSSAASPAPFSFSKSDSGTPAENKVEPNKLSMPSSLFSVTSSQTATPKTDSSSTSTPSTAFSSPFTASGFQFGNTTNADKGGFSFSAAPAKSAESLGKRTRDEAEGSSDSKSAKFAFGNPSNTAPAPAVNFKFGTTTATTTASSTSLFSFSANSSNKSDTATTGSAVPFGSSSLGGTGSLPTPFANSGFGATNANVFGNMASQPKESTPSGIFGAAAASAPAPNAGTGGFQFGNSTANSSGLFQFGATDNKPQTSVTPNVAPLGSSNGNAGFVFGQMPSDGSAQPFNVSTTPSFNFAPAPTGGTIQFGASGTPDSSQSNAFSIGRAPTSNPAGPRRQIRKAVRKLKK